jgi:hypothetical protein
MYNRTIEKLQLKSLTEFPGNPQEVPDDKMILIKDNMRRKGWYGEIPLVAKIDDKHYIVSGNHRVICAVSVGILEQDCIIIDDEKYGWEQAKKDVIMYNTLHGEPDQDKLKDLIDSMLDDYDLDIESLSNDIGIDEEGLSELLDFDGYLHENEIKEKDIDIDSLNLENKCPKCNYEW